VELEQGFPANFIFGQELMVWEALTVRAGLSSEPLRFSVGIAVPIKKMRVDVGIRTHSELGISKSAGLTFRK